MSSDSEDDYMAATFVSLPTTTAHRPGLIHSHKAQRNIAVAAKKRRLDEERHHHRGGGGAGQSKASMQRLECESREAGLQKPLTAENKGFAMLARMGYQAGQSLGSKRPAASTTTTTTTAEADASSNIEPIAIQIKNNRAGLGRDVAMQQLREHQSKLRREKLLALAAVKKELSVDEYRQRLIQKAQERQMDMDFGSCQRACRRLDLEESIEKPPLPWFWPKIEKPAARTEDEEEVTTTNDATSKDSDNSEDDEEECVYETNEKLDLLVNYLRTTYCYCHWCGVRFDDGDDLRKSCPGETKDEH